MDFVEVSFFPRFIFVDKLNRGMIDRRRGRDSIDKIIDGIVLLIVLHDIIITILVAAHPDIVRGTRVLLIVHKSTSTTVVLHSTTVVPLHTTYIVCSINSSM